MSDAKIFCRGVDITEHVATMFRFAIGARDDYDNCQFTRDEAATMIFVAQLAGFEIPTDTYLDELIGEVHGVEHQQQQVRDAEGNLRTRSTRELRMAAFAAHVAAKAPAPVIDSDGEAAEVARES